MQWFRVVKTASVEPNGFLSGGVTYGFLLLLP